MQGRRRPVLDDYYIRQVPSYDFAEVRTVLDDCAYARWSWYDREF